MSQTLFLLPTTTDKSRAEMEAVIARFGLWLEPSAFGPPAICGHQQLAAETVTELKLALGMISQAERDRRFGFAP
jgi:hypothetical protein